MGLNFRKKINILPGFSLNLSKSGVGISIGPKGAKISVRPDGQIDGNVSLNGTGLSYRKALKKKNKKD